MLNVRKLIIDFLKIPYYRRVQVAFDLGVLPENRWKMSDKELHLQIFKNIAKNKKTAEAKREIRNLKQKYEICGYY